MIAGAHSSPYYYRSMSSARHRPEVQSVSEQAPRPPAPMSRDRAVLCAVIAAACAVLAGSAAIAGSATDREAPGSLASLAL